MFIQNKYTKWYFQIITRAQYRGFVTGYSEKHHIVPRSLSGKNSSDNLAVLTAREHFICHWLLVKMTEGKERHSMIYALNGMKRNSSIKNQDRYATKITSRVFEKLKIEFSKIHSAYLKGKLLSASHRQKISEGRKVKFAALKALKK